MISGAVPAKSLRASGNIYIDATGKERKNLTLIAYDNVFNPSDGWAWGRGDNRKDFFSETIANSKAIETFKSFDAKVASSMFSEIKHDMKLIAEASNDFKPSKIMMIKDSKQADALIGYYSESALVIAKPSIKLVKDLNSFLSI